MLMQRYHRWCQCQLRKKDKRLFSLEAARPGFGTKAAVGTDKQQTVDIIFTSHAVAETITSKWFQDLLTVTEAQKISRKSAKLLLCSMLCFRITENFLQDIQYPKPKSSGYNSPADPQEQAVKLACTVVKVNIGTFVHFAQLCAFIN